MSLYIGRGTRVKFIRWTVLALVITLLTSVGFPASSVLAATTPISLSQPTDIEFYKTVDGETEMLIADSGNNRVIRATAEGEVLSTMEVNQVTAVTMDNDGLIYAAQSGASLQIHIFNPDGTVNAPPIDLNNKYWMNFGQGVDQRYIRNVIRFKQYNKEAIGVTYSENSLVNNAIQKNTKFSFTNLDNSGSGSRINLEEYSSVISGNNEVGQNMWYTYNNGVYIYPLVSIQNSTDKLADLTLDVVNKRLYVVSENQIMQTGYEGFVYPNAPVLSTWVSGNETYPIDLSNQIAFGPEGEVYMADTARDRIVIFSADGTSARTLGLSQDNTPKPAVGAFSKTVKQGLPVTFTSTDFERNYADPEERPMTDIRITSLPDSGKLQLNGIDVVKNQVIPVAELNTLAFVSASAFTGIKTTFGWQANNGAVFSDSVDVTIMLRIKGDANGDGVITPADALLVNKYIKGLITLTPSQIEALDMNDDGVLDAKDSALIMGVFLGINS
ncbi:dockerin type I domain-containing protein [Paenibacillus sp. 11B]|uniref:dockerin type I domain-containing protein n=1 Tax=unclassified Paenibacillus TaxID=185978 RepID=UPI00264DA83E|nr:dockerin type I domain-containing protein [Paenibacillus sp. 11B]MDN8588567.1 dockerin type I domain-containing protein [Paenibacillus sp. 11B]